MACFTCDEWLETFTEELKPFKGYGGTTAVTIPVGHSQFGTDIAAFPDVK